MAYSFLQRRTAHRLLGDFRPRTRRRLPQDFGWYVWVRLHSLTLAGTRQAHHAFLTLRRKKKSEMTRNNTRKIGSTRFRARVTEISWRDLVATLGPILLIGLVTTWAAFRFVHPAPRHRRGGQHNQGAPLLRRRTLRTPRPQQFRKRPTYEQPVIEPWSTDTSSGAWAVETRGLWVPDSGRMDDLRKKGFRRPTSSLFSGIQIIPPRNHRRRDT